MEVRQEQLRHVGDRDAGLQHARMGARAVIEDERVTGDLDDMARTGSFRRGGGDAGAEQGELHLTPLVSTTKHDGGRPVSARSIADGSGIMRGFRSSGRM